MMKMYRLLSGLLCTFVLITIFGMSQAQAAACLNIRNNQPDLNSLKIPYAAMPDGDKSDDSHSPKKEATCGGTMTYVLNGRPITLNPLLYFDSASYDLIRKMFDTLLGNSLNSYRMADKIEIKPVGSRGQSVTFTLRAGLKFSNGDPVTAEDVRFTFGNLIYPEEINTSLRDLIACGDGKLPILKVESINAISFICNVAPGNVGIYLGNIPILNKRKVLALVPNVEKSPKAFASALGISTNPPQLEGLGAGPFVMSSSDPATAIEFKRNKFYWASDENDNQLPYLDGIRIVIASGDQAQNVALQKFANAETDWVIPHPNAEDILNLINNNKLKWAPVNEDADTGIPAEGTTFWTFSWTTQGPALRAAFRNQEFRQAMSYLSDREKMKQDDFFSYATVTHFSLNPLSPYHVERDDPKQSSNTRERATKAKFAFDPEKAKVILDKLGVRPGTDGKRVIPANFDGQGNPATRLEFTLVTNQGVRVRESMIDRLIADAARIGITIRKELVTPTELAERLISGDFEAILAGLGGGYTPESSANVFMCQGNLHFYHVNCPRNPTEFEKQVDTLYRAGLAEQDLTKDREIWDEFQILMGLYQPLIYLVQPHLLFLYRVNVLRNHGRAPLAVQDLVYCVSGRCMADGGGRTPDDKGNNP